MRQHFHRVFALLLILVISACTTMSPPSVSTSPVQIQTKEIVFTLTAEPTLDPEFALEDLATAKFDNPTDINNQWFPLTPGMQYIFDGFTDEGGRKIPHRIVYNVTDLTKVVAGVQTVAVYILDYSDSQLVEAEIAFYAQANDGTVWFLGEYPEVYEDGQLVEAPSWFHGLKGAKAGIVMKANPEVGKLSYAQGWGPAVNWTDRGRVVALGEQTCVPVNCYENVLVIEEFSQSEPDGFQVKYYAPGVGNVRVGWRGADASREEIELVELTRLTPEALAEIRAGAFALEASAFNNSKEVYARTDPMQLPDGSSVNAAPTAGPTQVASAEIVVYASGLPRTSLFELDFYDDSASPGGKLIGLPNSGDELDPPPENDPHVTFTVSVQSGIPYRCWIHMKVGTPKGKSLANLIWVQLSSAVDKLGREVFSPGSSSYLTAQGPTQEGWAWVGCNANGSDSLIYFQSSGEITVRLQAGMEGVGFDQFILSSSVFLENPPSEPIVTK
jgi:hypothetical protein